MVKQLYYLKYIPDLENIQPNGEKSFQTLPYLSICNSVGSNYIVIFLCLSIDSSVSWALKISSGSVKVKATSFNHKN